MKIIRIASLPPQLSADIHPDSAIILPGRPLFLPDFGNGWSASVHPAVRICRLGKNISRKFAPRYYDGLTLALRLIPSGNSSALDDGLLSGMDSSLVHGEWLPATLAAEPISAVTAVTETEIGPLADVIDSVIAAVSGYMTLKMGDIILLPPVGAPVPLSEGSRLDASLAGTQVLDQKIV